MNRTSPSDVGSPVAGEPTGGAVCVGIAVLDVIQRVETFPRWGVKSVADEVELAAGGPATNAAVTAAAVLGSCTVVTALGSGPQADLVRADLARHRVTVVDCAPDGWQLPVATCIVDASGERTVVSTGATDSVVPLTDEGHAAVQAATVLLLDGHHPAAAEAAMRTRQPDCVAVLDAGSAKAHVEPWLPMLDVAAGSADYAAGLGLSPRQALSHVLDAGAHLGVITDGARPLLWATRDEPEPVELRPPQVNAVDTLGAGDAFHGALLAALVQGRGYPEAIRFAAELASTRVSRRGARAWLSDLAPLVSANCPPDHVGSC